jgi:hypothetical protein
MGCSRNICWEGVLPNEVPLLDAEAEAEALESVQLLFGSGDFSTLGDRRTSPGFNTGSMQHPTEVPQSTVPESKPSGTVR